MTHAKSTLIISGDLAKAVDDLQAAGKLTPEAMNNAVCAALTLAQQEARAAAAKEIEQLKANERYLLDQRGALEHKLARAHAEGKAEGPRVGVAVVINNGDHILLGRRGKEPNYGKWVVPGGGVHHGESWRVTGEREVKEETGLRVSVREQAPAVVEVTAPGEHRIILAVHAEYGGGTACAASDMLEVAWFPRDALPPDLSPVAERLLNALAPLPGPLPAGEERPAAEEVKP